MEPGDERSDPRYPQEKGRRVVNRRGKPKGFPRAAENCGSPMAAAGSASSDERHSERLLEDERGFTFCWFDAFSTESNGHALRDCGLPRGR